MDKMFLSVREFSAASGLGRNSIYAAIKRKEIQAFRIGRRLLIPCHTRLHASIAKEEGPPVPLTSADERLTGDWRSYAK